MKLKKQIKKARKNPSRAARRLTKNAIARPARAARDAAKVAKRSVKSRGAVRKQMRKALASVKKASRYIGGAAAGVAAAVMTRKGQKALKDAGIRNLDDAKGAVKELGAKLKEKSKQGAERAVERLPV